MTDLEPLRLALTALGVGKIYGPYKNGDGNKPFWRLSVDGFEPVQAASAMIWPWLSPRRKAQVVRALEVTKAAQAEPRANRLTFEDRQAIRGSEEPSKVLAARFEVSTRTINDVRSGRTWTKDF